MVLIQTCTWPYGTQVEGVGRYCVDFNRGLPQVLLVVEKLEIMGMLPLKI